MKKGLMAALAVVVLAGIAYAASATYSRDTLTVVGLPGSMVHVYGEQPDASYLLVGEAPIDISGQVQFFLQPQGPFGNGLPQFRILITPGNEWLTVPDEEGGWHWD